MGRLHRGARAAGAFLTLFASSASPAFADEVSGLRSELLTERSHVATLTMHAGHAELVVRRTVWNGAEKSDEATFMIDVPEGAVATGLRTLGSLAGRPHWFKGELMEAEAAAAKYRELTGIGGYYPKDPALLSWRSQGLLALQVFPCLGRQEKTIEYTLALPTHYRDGAFHLEVPALGTSELVADIVLRSADPSAKLLVEGAPPPAVLRPERGSPLGVTLVPRSLPTLGGELVALEFAKERALTRFAVRAAPRLAEVPRNARIVLALDASLSTPSSFVDDAKAALDAYLSHFEDADVQLLVFHRTVERPFGGFLTVREARKRLETLVVSRGNGSEVDRALSEADRTLARLGSGRPRRIVLVTDGRGRLGLTPERLRAATATSGAAVHVGILGNGEPALERDDEHPWARALKSNHGLVWQASIDANQTKDAKRVYEEWARPVRLHGFRLSSPDLELSEVLAEQPTELAEGQGVAELRIGGGVVPWLEVEGELWTRRVKKRFERDPKPEKLWSALVFGSELVDELSESEMMTLAMKGGAVSPVTSYLAIEPGVRPSTEGIEWSSAVGLGRAFGSGMGLGRPAAVRVDDGRNERILREKIARALERCGGRPGSAHVSLETTLSEIVHVASVDVENDEATVAHCLGEAVWNLLLPASFDWEHKSWSISV